MNRKYTKKILHILPALLLLFTVFNRTEAQSLKRACIPACGSTSAAGSVQICQTTGQCFATVPYGENSMAVLPGFQQPRAYAIKKINTEASRLLRLHVFPNPATVNLTVKSDESLDNILLQITDFNGRIILSQTLSCLLIHKIDCESWRSGAYLLTVSDSQNNYAFYKVIIQK